MTDPIEPTEPKSPAPEHDPPRHGEVGHVPLATGPTGGAEAETTAGHSTGEPPAASLDHEAADPDGIGPLDHDAPRPATKRRDPLPVLFGIGVLVLIGAVVFLWRHPLNLASFSSAPAAPRQATAAPPNEAPPTPGENPPPPAPAITANAAPAPAAEPAPPPPAATPAAVKAEDAPPPPTPVAAPAPVTAPVTAPVSAPLSAKTEAPPSETPANAAPQPAAPQLQALEQRLTQLEQQHPPMPDLAPLEARIAALEKRPLPPPAPDLSPQLTALANRINTLETRQEQVASKQASDGAALASRIDADEARVAALVKQVADLAGVSDRAGRLARIQAAAAALDAGRPLGDLPNAPPALERFRATAPPTEASLRLTFPAAARAAETAGEPDTGRLPFWQAVRDRAESLVTVRRGDQVLVGDPASAVIARARVALEAGDLAGAVTALGALTGAPATAMAPWTSQAKALLEARAALAALAARA